MLNIAIVEDYDLLRDELVHFLSRPHWRVTSLHDGAALEQHLQTQPVDVVVLDLNLPDQDGLVIARRLRQSGSHIAIVMLTARSSAQHRAKGFCAGADVFLTKPTQTTEIEAVIANLEKRLCPPEPPQPTTTSPAQLHTHSGQLQVPNGHALSLSPAQVRLLQALAQQHPQPIDSGVLCQALGSQDASNLSQLRVHITRLRRKWHSSGGAGRLLEPVRGQGYRLTSPIELH